MPNSTRTLIIAAGGGLGAQWKSSKSRFVTLTEGYLEIRISIKVAVTVMTTVQPYIVYISISLNHLRLGVSLSSQPVYHLSSVVSVEIMCYNGSLYIQLFRIISCPESHKIINEWKMSIKVNIWLHFWNLCCLFLHYKFAAPLCHSVCFLMSLLLLALT